MKKIKQVFPSRNYITIDSYGDVEVIFNPVGDGLEGDDKLMFRKGRWAFRVNDFLSGKVMADGSKEGMGRKVYSLNLVYDDEDGEPLVNTTYVDPTSVIPLDGSVVDVVGVEKLAQKELQSIGNGYLNNIQNDVGNIFSNVEAIFNDGAKSYNQEKMLVLQEKIESSLIDDSPSRGTVALKLEWLLRNLYTYFQYVDPEDNSIYEDFGDMVYRNFDNLSRGQDKIIANCSGISLMLNDGAETDPVTIFDEMERLEVAYSERHKVQNVTSQSLGGNKRYSVGTVFYFGDSRFIALRTDCISISVGSDILLLGDLSEYSNGTVQRLNGAKFAIGDVTKIFS